MSYNTLLAEVNVVTMTAIDDRQRSTRKEKIDVELCIRQTEILDETIISSF
jgi:hypothetical protein